MDRLLKVGSMADSVGLYVPAMVFQKALHFARVLVFWHLLGGIEYGLWGVSSMVFTLASSVVTLGAYQGLVRYVSYYEARGDLPRLFRAAGIGSLLIGLATTALAVAGSAPLTRWIVVPSESGADVPFAYHQMVFVAAMVNALAMALYHTMLSFLIGLRTYRLVSLIEVAYAILFAAGGAAALVYQPTGLAALWAHAAALGAMLLAGVPMLRACIARSGPQSAGDDAVASLALEHVAESDQAVASPAGPDRAAPLADAAAPLLRVVRFGLVTLVGTFLWHAATYLSYWMVHRRYGESAGGAFQGFLRLAQPIVYIANAAWAVIFSHVARRWEASQRREAMFSLETSFKAVVFGTMTLSVLLYATLPAWVWIVPDWARKYGPVAGGLLMLFQTVTNLSLMTILAKLRERPGMIAWAALAGLGANALLAWWWMPRYGVTGAAWAAGVGMLLGAGAVNFVYLLGTRAGVSAGAYAAMACPLVLLLPPLWSAGAWAVVLALAAFTPLLFAPRQKQAVRYALRKYLRAIGRLGR